jgi:hypothetical protein
LGNGHAASPRREFRQQLISMRTELQIVLASVREMTAEELPHLIGELESVKATAWARLSAPSPTPQQHDDLLDIEAAAERLGVSKDYLYRNHSKLSFTRRMGKRLLFSSLGIDRHIKQAR